jgi:hypothetical protein
MINASTQPAKVPKKHAPVVMKTGEQVIGFASGKLRLLSQTDPTQKKPVTMTF